MEQLLREQVKKALAFDNLRTAIFLGERLCAKCDSEENIVLLGKCYIRNRQDYRAIHLLKKANELSPSGDLLLAQCLYRSKSEDTEIVMLRAEEQAERQAKDTPEQSTERFILAEVYYLHGLYCKTKARFDLAINLFKEALIQNPFLWSAFEELCNLGGNDEIDSHLKQLKSNFGTDSNRMEVCEDSTSDISAGKATVLTEPAHQVEGPILSTLQRHCPPNDSFVTPPRTTASMNEIREANNSPRTPPTRSNAIPPCGRLLQTPTKFKGNAKTSRRRSISRGDHDRAGKLQKVNTPAGPDVSLMDGTPSTDSMYYSASEQNSSNMLMNVGCREALGTENEEHTKDMVLEPTTVCLHQDNSNLSDGMKEFYQFVYTLSEYYYAVSNFNHRGAKKFLENLSPKQQDTAWTATKLGCLAMQKANYENSKEMFSKARQLDPTHVEDMDLYSSVLYLLADNPLLNALAKELKDLDRLAPQTWCAVGNLHSLLRDHRTALDAFKRAIQLDPSRPYSYTLCGHALMALEDHSKAREHFRQATVLDRRHHLGWHGLGLVELHAEQFTAAATAFETAVGINSVQAVYRLNHGKALAQLGRSNEAKEEFVASKRLDRKSKAACFEMGKLCYGEKKFSEANNMFQAAAKIDTRDADIFYYLGVTYKRLGETEKATDALQKGLDLNPGSVLTANIRAALDKINQDDDDPHRKY